MPLSQAFRRLVNTRTEPSESLLRPNSPVRVWLARRRENSEATAGTALLGALTDPACDWVDRAVGYAALREIDLSPTERAHANRILAQALARFQLGTDLLPRLGRLVIPVGVFSLIGSGLVATFDNVYSLGLAGVCVLPLLLAMDQEMREGKRTGMVQQAAAATLAQTGDPECIAALNAHVRRRSPLRPEAVRALQAILPTVTADDYRRLPPDIEQALITLAGAPDEALALEALDALERLGDGRYASALAPILSKVRSAQVRARGAVVLPLLEARHEPGSDPVALPRRFEFPSKKHPLRLWLTRCKTGQPTGSSAALLCALSAPHATWADRAQGFQALCQLDLSPSERLQANHLLSHALTLTGESNALPRRISYAAALALLYGIGVGGAAALLAVALSLLDHSRGFLPTILHALEIGCSVAGLFTILVTPLTLIGVWLKEPQDAVAVQKAAVNALGKIGGPECVAALDDHVVHYTPIRKEALQAIKQILPAITPDWYGRLPAGVGPILLNMADSSNENVACLAIDAIGRAGGGNCLEGVTRVAQRSSSEQRRARAAAILPILTERRDRETSAGTLLRPSQAATTDHLLLPVYATDPDTSNLLRASDQNKSIPETTP